MLLSAECYWFKGNLCCAGNSAQFSSLCVTDCGRETSFRQNFYVVLSPLWTVSIDICKHVQLWAKVWNLRNNSSDVSTRKCWAGFREEERVTESFPPNNSYLPCLYQNTSIKPSLWMLFQWLGSFNVIQTTVTDEPSLAVRILDLRLLLTELIKYVSKKIMKVKNKTKWESET